MMTTAQTKETTRLPGSSNKQAPRRAGISSATEDNNCTREKEKKKRETRNKKALLFTLLGPYSFSLPFQICCFHSAVPSPCVSLSLSLLVNILAGQEQ